MSTIMLWTVGSFVMLFVFMFVAYDIGMKAKLEEDRRKKQEEDRKHRELLEALKKERDE